MPLPRVHPWCCEDVAEPVLVYVPTTPEGQPWLTCYLSRCVTVAPSGIPENGCCRCLRPSRLWYQTQHSWLPAYLPGGQRVYIRDVHEWRGRGPRVCGLGAVSLLFGAIDAPHGRRWAWMLVYHDGQFREGLWVLLADYFAVEDCSEARIGGVAPQTALGYATSAALWASCIIGHGNTVRPGFAIDWDDPCIQSPERCVDPPLPGELCRGGIPPALMARLWGPPVDDHSGCRLNGHGFVLTRRPDDVHGHGDVICEDERQSAVYEGTILECTLGHASLPIRVTLYRPYNAEFRQRLEVALQLGGGTYIKRVRECEELPQLTFRVNERLFDLLPVSEARIEPYDGPQTPAAAGLWCPPRWAPPCPRPARLLAEIGVQTAHADECVAVLGWWAGERYVTFRVVLPCVNSGELDEMSGCCEWRGNMIISPVQVTGTWGHERVMEWNGDILMRTRYVAYYNTGWVRAVGSAYLGRVYGHDVWMNISYEDWFQRAPEPPWFHQAWGIWALYVAGVGGYWSTGWSRLQALP